MKIHLFILSVLGFILNTLRSGLKAAIEIERFKRSFNSLSKEERLAFISSMEEEEKIRANWHETFDKEEGENT